MRPFLVAIAILCIGYFFFAAGPHNLRKPIEWGKRAPGWLLAAAIAFPFLAAHWARRGAAWLRSHRPHLPWRPGRVRGGKHALRAEVAR